MKKIFALLGLFCVVFQLSAQIPTVPNQMVFAGIELSISNSARSEIQEHVNKIHGNATFFHKMVAQADIYFPVIEAEFAKTQFPDQIKYLCIQESAFKAEAVSTSNAVGYWQFKEATAVEQGLIVDRHIDERKNIASSSFAAARYITAHNKALDNWIYAVIAYNTGLGGVKQFYNSKFAGEKKMEITKDTHWYFLKFLAHVIAYQDFVGKNTPEIKLQVYTQTSGKSIRDFAEEHNKEVEELKPFNLWINEHHKITDEKNVPVIVPIAYIPFVQTDDKKEKATIEPEKEKPVEKTEPLITLDKPSEVAVNIEDAPKNNLKYSVNGLPAITAIEGDNSSTLAIKAGLERKKFLKYNEIKSFEDLVPGQTYFLKKKKSKSNTLYHTAQRGETLWMISQHYGIKEKSLRSKNRMSKHESVQPGRVIWLNGIRPETVAVEYKELPKPVVIPKEEPKKEEVKAEVKKEIIVPTEVKKVEEEDTIPAKYLHWVQPQENLSMIARLYQVKPQEIKTWNHLTSDTLKVGMKLRIFESELSVKIVSDSALDKSIEDFENEPKLEIVVPVEEEAPQATENKVLETTTGVPMVRKTMNFKSILVEPGTTMYGLSREYKVSVEEIKEYNQIVGNSLNAGDTILIPIYTETVAESENLQTYVVQQGDTFYSISKKLGVSVEEIKVKNNKTDNSLKVGEELKY